MRRSDASTSKMLRAPRRRAPTIQNPPLHLIEMMIVVRKTRFIACWRKSRERYLQAEDSTGEEVTKGIYTRSTTQRRVRASTPCYLQAEDSTGEEVTKGIYTRSTTQRRVRASTPCFACGGWRLGFEDDRQTRDPTPLARHRHYRYNERRYVRQVGATKKGRRRRKKKTNWAATGAVARRLAAEERSQRFWNLESSRSFASVNKDGTFRGQFRGFLDKLKIPTMFC